MAIRESTLTSVSARVEKIGVGALKCVVFPGAPGVELMSFAPYSSTAEQVERIGKISAWNRHRGTYDLVGPIGGKGSFWRSVALESKFGPQLKNVMYGSAWVPTGFFDSGLTKVIRHGKKDDGKPWFPPGVISDKTNFAGVFAYLTAILEGQMGADKMWLKPTVGEDLILPLPKPSPICLANDIEGDIIRWSCMLPNAGIAGYIPLPPEQHKIGEFIAYDTLIDRVKRFGRRVQQATTSGHLGIRAHRIVMGAIRGAYFHGSWDEIEKRDHPVTQWYLSLANLPLMLMDPETVYDGRGRKCSALEYEGFANNLLGYIGETDRGTVTSRARLDVVQLSDAAADLDAYRCIATTNVGEVQLKGAIVVPRIGGHSSPVIVAQPNIDGGNMWLGRRDLAEEAATGLLNSVEDIYNTPSLTKAGQVLRAMGAETGITVITGTDDGRLAFVKKLSYCDNYKPLPFDVSDPSSPLVMRYGYSPYTADQKAFVQATVSRVNEWESWILDAALIMAKGLPTISMDGAVYAAPPSFGLPQTIPEETNAATLFAADSIDLNPLYIHGSPQNLPGAKPVSIEYREYLTDDLSTFLVRKLVVDMSRLLQLASAETNIGFLPSPGQGLNIDTGAYMVVQQLRCVLGHVNLGGAQRYLAWYISEHIIKSPMMQLLLVQLATQGGIPVREATHTHEFATLHSLYFAALMMVQAEFARGSAHPLAVLGQHFALDSDHYIRTVFSALTKGRVEERKPVAMLHKVDRTSLRVINVEIPSFTYVNVTGK